jgi:hypothetical protein
MDTAEPPTNLKGHGADADIGRGHCTPAHIAPEDIAPKDIVPEDNGPLDNGIASREQSSLSYLAAASK